MKRLLAGLLILAAWGCQSTPDPHEDTAALPEAEQRLERRLANRQLQTALQLIEEQRWSAAESALAEIEPTQLGERGIARYLLARATLAYQRGNLTEARALLLALDAELLPDPDAAARLATRLQQADPDPVTMATDLMARQSMRGRGQELNDDIWRLVDAVPAFDVQVLAEPRVHDGVATDPAGTEIAHGWWTLAAAMHRSLSIADQQRRLADWQEHWPQHPAAVAPPAALARISGLEPRRQRIAVLLPVSGPLRQAGRAVRDGFTAAYLERRDDVDFELRFYDTGAESIPALYERALADRADRIIGPLQREAVATLNGLNPEIPVLALNNLTGQAPAPNLLQLGLAIEDEARTLVRGLERSGVERLLVFHTGAEWSMRALHELQTEWDGSTRIQRLHDIRTVTESVGTAMNVAASQERRSELEELLREQLEFSPRARSDIDAIVALVPTVEAHALVPALRFHFADHLPLYLTSQTVRGVGGDQLGQLSGAAISELPAFVHQRSGGPDPTGQSAPNEALFEHIENAFGLAHHPFGALYALGVDAFRVSERMELLRDGTSRQLLGSTGALRISADGRFQRQLALGVIGDGRVTPRPALGAR